MKKTTLLFLFVLISGKAMFGWGDKGHKIVSEIAEKCLEKSIVDSVNFYLGKMTFQEASVWMDAMRSDNSYNYMKPWHYINVEKDATYVKTKEENVVNKLDECIEVLKNRKKHTHSEINMALKIIFHLVGDIHQPLHNGYANDKGGNSVDVDFAGQQSNLHKVWDSGIIEKGKINLSDCLKMANELGLKEGKELQDVNVTKWMLESRELLPGVYAFEKGIITQAYIDKNKPIVEKQLVRGGIRLAAILHQAFKK